MLHLLLLLSTLTPSPSAINLEQLSAPGRVYSAAQIGSKVMLNIIGTKVGEVRHFLFDMATEHGHYLNYQDQSIFLTQLHTIEGQFYLFSYQYKKVPKLFSASADGTNLQAIDLSHIEPWQGELLFLFACKTPNHHFLVNWQGASDREVTYYGILDPVERSLTNIKEIKGISESEHVIVPFHQGHLQLDLFTSEILYHSPMQKPKTLAPAKPKALFRVRNFDNKELWHRTLFHLHATPELIQFETSHHSENKDTTYTILQLHPDQTLQEVTFLLLGQYQKKSLIWKYPKGKIELEIKD